MTTLGTDEGYPWTPIIRAHVREGRRSWLDLDLDQRTALALLYLGELGVGVLEPLTSDESAQIRGLMLPTPSVRENIKRDAQIGIIVRNASIAFAEENLADEWPRAVAFVAEEEG